MDFCTCLLNSHSLSSMKDDAYIYNNVIPCIFWCKILGRADALNCAALRPPCIVIIDSLHRISCGIVIIHLTIAKHRDVIFISSVGYDSSSHQPFRKEAVTNQIASRSLAYQLLIYQCL